MRFEADMANSDVDVRILREVAARYERAFEMARETLCTCQAARDPTYVAWEVVRFLLAGEVDGGGGPTTCVEFRRHHCPLHSPPVAERPWLLEVRP